MDSVSLGTDVVTGEEVRLGITERRQGLYIIGKTGTGKTTLLEHLIVQDIEAGLGVCVLDPHGDLIEAILARVPPERERDLVLLDLADSQYPFGLNLFECKDTSDRNLVSRVATQAVEVFEKLWGATSWGPQLAQVLRNCAYTLIENPGYSLADLRRLLLNSEFRTQLVANVTNPQVVEFWELEYNPMRPQDQQQIVRSTLNKVDEFLTPAVYPIVGYGKTTIDFRKSMDAGKLLLVRLGLGEVGAAAVSLIGSMIVGQLFNAALSRQDVPPAQRRQFNLYADEYHRFATPAFAELLAEARKYALATTLAHQYRGQLEDEANRGATLNVANLVVFAVHGEDAEELAKQFPRTLPPAEVVGQRPRLSISQDPVSHLVRMGHVDPKVRWPVERILQPLMHLAKIIPEETERPSVFHATKEVLATHDVYSPYVVRHQNIPYKIRRQDVAEGLRQINKYLVELMEGRSNLSLVGMEYLKWVLEHNRALFGFAQETLGYDYPLDHSIALRRFLRSRYKVVHEWFPEDGYVEGVDYQAALVDFRVAAIVAYSVDSPLQYEKVYGSRPPAENARSEVRRIEEYADLLYALGKGLLEAPVLVDSGQWEPIYDRPRTYSDVEAEIASALVGLSKYKARCRVSDGHSPIEHTIRTPEFRALAISPEAEARIGRIRGRTRMEYCAPLAEVLAAIRARQRHRDEEVPPRTQRRSPVIE